MHELSLAQDILRIVEEAAARERFAQVRVLRLEAGALAGVEVSALRFALDAIRPGTCLAGAQIDIDQPMATAWCPECAAEVVVDSRIDPCPRCGGMQIQVRGGAQLRVLEVLVDDAASSPSARPSPLPSPAQGA